MYSTSTESYNIQSSSQSINPYSVLIIFVISKFKLNYKTYFHLRIQY